LRFEPLFASEELGLHPAANIEHVIKAFLVAAEGVATRQIEMPKSVLLLQTIAGNSQSGAIYLYDRERQHFYLAVFERGSDDCLSISDFDQLVDEYDLLRYAEHPRKLMRVNSTGCA
jgi:hypothetical protein